MVTLIIRGHVCLVLLGLVMSGCASAKVQANADASADSNSPFDIIMPELPPGDGLVDQGDAGDGPRLDQSLEDVGPGQDLLPDSTVLPDLYPKVDVKAPPDQVVPDISALMKRWQEVGDTGGNAVFVTGPSRTADIEKELVLGIHGPQTVDVILLV